MAKSNAAIFKEMGTIENPELLDQLDVAIEELVIEMKATVPITKGSHRIGFGADKIKRGIAADAVISIAKAIKGLRGW